MVVVTGKDSVYLWAKRFNWPTQGVIAEFFALRLQLQRPYINRAREQRRHTGNHHGLLSPHDRDRRKDQRKLSTVVKRRYDHAHRWKELALAWTERRTTDRAGKCQWRQSVLDDQEFEPRRTDSRLGEANQRNNAGTAERFHPEDNAGG